MNMVSLTQVSAFSPPYATLEVGLLGPALLRVLFPHCMVLYPCHTLGVHRTALFLSPFNVTLTGWCEGVPKAQSLKVTISHIRYGDLVSTMSKVIHEPFARLPITYLNQALPAILCPLFVRKEIIKNSVMGSIPHLFTTGTK
jgi:hypothetical protein